MEKQILCQGAEAIITKEEDKVIKQRIKKSYRLPELDKKLREQRTRKEAKLLKDSSKYIPVPVLISSSDKETKIVLEFLDGKKLSEHLNTLKNAEEVCKQIGENIAKLHNEGIIHGDITTSNMILKSKEVERQGTLVPYEVYFIDFGLGFNSQKTEDKAVDLHLIKQALEAKHFEHFEKFFNAVLAGYKSASKNPNEILKRLEKVELRGRYKQAG